MFNFSGHLSVPPQPPPRSGRLNMPMQQQHFDVVSPPLSGRSTPKAHVPNVMARGQDSSAYNMHKYHTVSYLKHFFFVIKIICSVLFSFSLTNHKVFVSFTVI